MRVGRLAPRSTLARGSTQLARPAGRRVVALLPILVKSPPLRTKIPMSFVLNEHGAGHSDYLSHTIHEVKACNCKPKRPCIAARRRGHASTPAPAVSQNRRAAARPTCPLHRVRSKPAQEVKRLQGARAPPDREKVRWPTRSMRSRVSFLADLLAKTVTANPRDNKNPASVSLPHAPPP